MSGIFAREPKGVESVVARGRGWVVKRENGEVPRERVVVVHEVIRDFRTREYLLRDAICLGRGACEMGLEGHLQEFEKVESAAVPRDGEGVGVQIT